jgi:TFIIF-interacting CTD phosphatase-like protein
MLEFIQKLQELGTVSVFTFKPKKYADPILDKLDPQGKYFKHRFYREHCLNCDDGKTLKDMSVI